MPKTATRSCDSWVLGSDEELGTRTVTTPDRRRIPAQGLVREERKSRISPGVSARGRENRYAVLRPCLFWLSTTAKEWQR